MEKRKFISSAQRTELEKAYEIMDKVYASITIDHEERTYMWSSLLALKRAIECERKFYKRQAMR